MLICSVHHCYLTLDVFGEKYLCREGCSFPIIDNIPRFVSSENYASSFGLQWNKYRTTQLDSFTGTSISKDRLTRLIGGSLDVLKGKKILEAGCGAGRFTEILLAAGAHVFAIDLSVAVKANYQNCIKYSNYFVCQADLCKIPLKPEYFDVVICIGVIQHTPDPEQTIISLCTQVAPGGLLVIDHYTYKNRYTSPTRRLLRTFLKRMPKTFSFQFCRMLTLLLWPLHRISWEYRRFLIVKKMRTMLCRFLSPVNDYHEVHPELGARLLKEWALLDTHDSLTDFYKHLRSSEDIDLYLRKNGMVDIEAVYVGNKVEARARKPPDRSLLLEI